MTPDDLHAEGVGLLRSFPWRQALGMRLVQYANAWWYDRKRLEEAEEVSECEYARGWEEGRLSAFAKEETKP